MDITIKENVELAPYTTFGVGGPARFFVSVTTEDALRTAVQYAQEEGLSWCIIGGGSNVVVNDEGFSGLIIHMEIRGVMTNEEIVTVAAGEDWDSFVEMTVERGLQGLECLSGIPGTVGAAPIQNIGAYGAEVADAITHVRVYDVAGDVFRVLSKKECEFAYRTSMFKKQCGKYVIVGVTFKLSRANMCSGTYAGLPEQATLYEMRDAVLKIRKEKGMIAGCYRSTGSFFKNPIIPKGHYGKLLEHYSEIPSYSVHTGTKVPAAWLIEQAGFTKGTMNSSRTVMTSPKHALALVANDDATANDIYMFAQTISDAVLKCFAISLEHEVQKI